MKQMQQQEKVSRYGKVKACRQWQLCLLTLQTIEQKSLSRSAFCEREIPGGNCILSVSHHIIVEAEHEVEMRN